MRLCTFSAGDATGRAGLAIGDATVIDIHVAAAALDIAVPDDGGLLGLFEAEALGAVQELAERVGDAGDEPWRHAVGAVTLHHPYRPRKNVIRAGGNSRTLNGAPKDAPGVVLPPGRWLKGFPVRYYTKSPSAVLDPGGTVTWPEEVTTHVYAEAQLAIVIGRTIKYVGADEALAAVAGYAVATDVVSHDLKLKHGQWPKAVSLDSFFPWGPFIVTSDEVADPDALGVRLTLNGEEVLSGSTSDTMLPVGEMLAQISDGIVLEPGDVLLLGAAECVGFARDPARWLQAGDEVASTIDGLGTLTNPVTPYQLG